MRTKTAPTEGAYPRIESGVGRSRPSADRRTEYVLEGLGLRLVKCLVVFLGLELPGIVFGSSELTVFLYKALG